MTPEETAELVKRLRAVASHLEQDPHGNPVEAAINRRRARDVTVGAAVLESLRSSLESRDTTIDKLESEREGLIQELEHSQKQMNETMIQLGDLQQRHLTMIRELAKEKA